MGKTAVGGTFEYLHDGHKELLRKAFEVAAGSLLEIGLTSDMMAGAKGRDIPDYHTRKQQLINFIETLPQPGIYHIQMLNDPYGSTLEEEYDTIVVSPETYPVAQKINQIREAACIPPLKIVRIDYILAQDKDPISSTRISLGEIDIHGKLK